MGFAGAPDVTELSRVLDTELFGATPAFDKLRQALYDRVGVVVNFVLPDKNLDWSGFYLSSTREITVHVPSSCVRLNSRASIMPHDRCLFQLHSTIRHEYVHAKQHEKRRVPFSAVVPADGAPYYFAQHEIQAFASTHKDREHYKKRIEKYPDSAQKARALREFRRQSGRFAMQEENDIIHRMTANSEEDDPRRLDLFDESYPASRDFRRTSGRANVKLRMDATKRRRDKIRQGVK